MLFLSVRRIRARSATSTNRAQKIDGSESSNEFASSVKTPCLISSGVVVVVAGPGPVLPVAADIHPRKGRWSKVSMTPALPAQAACPGPGCQRGSAGLSFSHHQTVVRGTEQESNLICFSDTKYPETSFFSYEASVS